MIAQAIKGFNREWTAVTKYRDNNNTVLGWTFEARCGTIRMFPNTHWDDPHGAALRALENHRCGNA